jgi:putative endonuclease
MRDRCCLVFVEVRYRRHNRYASAAASIDRHKRRKLTLAAAVFTRCHAGLSDQAMRFDVVAFDHRGDGSATMTWLRDAFRPGD